MSMPIIEPSTTTRCQAITDVIESVALQQTGLSHIINAEGEKIQLALKLAEKDPDILLEINKSVQSMINSITRLEVILQGKLELFTDCVCEPCDTKEETIDVTFEINNNGGTITKGDISNLYLYNPGNVRGNIEILTAPESKVSQVGELPEGWTFVDNTLITPMSPNWKVQQLVKLRIGEETSKESYVITIVNSVV